jgi:hypothetical protein
VAGKNRVCSIGFDFPDPNLAPFTHTDKEDRIQTGRVTLYTGDRTIRTCCCPAFLPASEAPLTGRRGNGRRGSPKGIQ